MSDKSTFSHIVVNDEEEVFVVGARAAQAPEPAPAPEPEPEPSPAPEPPRVHKPQSDRYIATEEDINVAPMSGLQKAIIAVAIVAIIAFIVYSVAF